MNAFSLIWSIIFGLGLGYLLFVLFTMLENLKIIERIKKMKTFLERTKTLKSEILVKKSRINDSAMLEIQEEINKLKELIDNEVNRRAKNLSQQGGL
jgi:sensor histidine kinase YesM